MHRAAAVVLSAAIAYTGVLFSHQGLRFAGVLTLMVGFALSVVALRIPQFRRAAVPAMTFLGATLAIEGWGIAVAYGWLAWWRLGLTALIVLVVLIVTLAAEMAVPRRFAVRAASPVAAAALMVIPTFGVDVITAYHDTTPVLAALIVIALGHALWPRAFVMRIVEPAACVLAGWAAAQASGRIAPYEAWWLIALFAGPAVGAALIVAAIRSR